MFEFGDDFDGGLLSTRNRRVARPYCLITQIGTRPPCIVDNTLTHDEAADLLDHVVSEIIDDGGVLVARSNLSALLMIRDADDKWIDVQIEVHLRVMLIAMEMALEKTQRSGE